MRILMVLSIYTQSEPECKKINSGYQSPNSGMPAMQAVQQVSSSFFFSSSLSIIL